MQVSKIWLQDYLSESIDSLDLNELLTMAGLEVDAIQDFSELSDLIIVGEIVGIAKHPDADRLNVCQVDIGGELPLQIVCGAPNARLGIKVPCATVGAKLPEFEIKKAKLRGVESNGMLCSAKEIGLSQESEGLYELVNSLRVGETIKSALRLNDTVYTLSLTPNRADCLSIIGVAREISSITGISLNIEKTKVVKENFASSLKVTVEDKISCPRYCGREIRGVNNTNKLPENILSRLESGGIKSINPIVDITNFVLLEMGQPLHAFDHKKINGKILVRVAKEKETIKLLNDQEIVFSGKELIISDEKRPLALAGIMGGELSAVDSTTTDIFLESAFFDPTLMSGRARSFGLSTDSSHRFERGVDFANTLDALQRASELIHQYCGGESSEIIDLIAELPKRNAIQLRIERITSILGISIATQDIEKILERLHFDVKKDGANYSVTPPSYRFDIAIEEDLIEEVIRLYGYNNIPAILPSMPSNMLPVKQLEKSEHSIKLAFANHGYNEAITYSFIDKEIEATLHENPDAIELLNPIASQMNVMRSKLWANHLDTLTYNINRGQSQIRLFEIAPIYQKDKSGYKEILMVSGLVYGDSTEEQWSEKKRQVDFYDVKGDIESISINSLEFKVAKTNTPQALHPGQAAEIYHNDKSVGWLGKLHPSWQQHYELTNNTFIFEMTLASLVNQSKNKIEIPGKYNAVRRDIALVVDKKISVGDMVNAVKLEKMLRIVDFYPFDIYEGNGIDEDKKSVAFLILMQDTYKTLEDNDVNNLVESILQLLQNKFGAKLR